MTYRSRAFVTTVREVALSLAAVLGALCLIAALVAVVFDVRPVIFRSGSMSPTIGTGALGFVHEVPARDLQVRDIVTVHTDSGSVVTHRIVDLSRQGDRAQLRLKGDANTAIDAQTYTVSRAGRLLFHVPFLGRWLSWVNGPLGLFLLGLIAAVLLGMVVRGGPGRPHDEGPSHPHRRPRALAVESTEHTKRTERSALTRARVVAPMALCGVLVMSGPASAVPWTDDVTASAPLTAYTVPKPAWVSCNAAGITKTVTLTWEEVSSPYALDYVASVDGGGALTVTDNGSTRSVAVTSGLLGIGTFTIRVIAALPSPNGSWTSVALTQPVTFVTSLIASCGTPG